MTLNDIHPAVLVAGFCAGFVDSIAGGGGLISVPAFIAAGVPYPLLLGTNKSMAGVGSVVAVTRYARAGLLPRLGLPTWLKLLAFGCATSAIGAAISQLPFVLNRLKLLVPVLLLAVMAFLLKRWFYDERFGKRALSPADPAALARSPVPQATLSLIAGYDGLFGPGTGTFFLSYLEKLGFPTVTANAITKVLNLSSNIGALAVFAARDRILWPVGLSAAAAFMAGNYLGSGLVLQRGQALVRLTVVVTTSAMLVKYAWGW